METRRLRLLVELARLGSMREVAEESGLTTSTVSQQLAILARDVGAALVEPDGRRVRLTPAGRRLAEHGVTILAAVEAARLDLDPGATPAGSLRVAGFASAIRRSLLPVQAELTVRRSAVRLLIHEHEPLEAFALLDGDEMDLALTYDYNLAPREVREPLRSTPAVDRAVGARRATRRHGRPGVAARLDRQLAQHRRRGRGAHPGRALRVRAADRAPLRQASTWSRT